MKTGVTEKGFIVYSEILGPRSCKTGRIYIAEKRGPWLDLQIQNNRRKDKKLITGMIIYMQYLKQ